MYVWQKRHIITTEYPGYYVIISPLIQIHYTPSKQLIHLFCFRGCMKYSWVHLFAGCSKFFRWSWYLCPINNLTVFLCIIIMKADNCGFKSNLLLFHWLDEFCWYFCLSHSSTMDQYANYLYAINERPQKQQGTLKSNPALLERASLFTASF